MDRIVPHLWFDNHAKEAANFYMTLFDDSNMTLEQKLDGTPSGENAAYYEFTLAGQLFGALNGGSHFTFNPAISLSVNCDTKEETEALWDKLIDGGKALMALQEYPFSELYGWVEDRYGLSWQVIYTGGFEYDQKITVQLMFSGEATGKAKEAMTYYTTIFKDGVIGDIHQYEEGQAKQADAEIAHANFSILDTEIFAADNGNETDYTFNDAISLMVVCVTQAEIDYYWEKLTADPAAEQCGWLKDKFGVSWQIVPANMNDLMSRGTQAQVDAVTQEFLQMKKLDIKHLERAWELAAEQIDWDKKKRRILRLFCVSTVIF